MMLVMMVIMMVMVLMRLTMMVGDDVDVISRVANLSTNSIKFLVSGLNVGLFKFEVNDVAGECVLRCCMVYADDGH